VELYLHFPIRLHGVVVSSFPADLHFKEAMMKTENCIFIIIIIIIIIILIIIVLQGLGLLACSGSEFIF
jgi:hypothetical protein